MMSIPQPLDALVLTNSSSAQFWQARDFVLPYLAHFGVPHRLVDLLYEVLPTHLTDYPLIILAHPAIDPEGRRVATEGWSALRDAVQAGTGLLSFDPVLSLAIAGEVERTETTAIQQLQITSTEHFITSRHTAGQNYQLCSEILAPSIPGEALLAGDGRSYLSCGNMESGRAVHWAGAEWMTPQVLGPLSGLDDLFWRGLVWAARKPFVLRGLPPLVTMRVDDVAGRGGLWDESPLYWVDDSIRSGFKPWLGLFIYNLDPQTVSQVRGQITTGGATAFPHAFGRPPRSGSGLSRPTQPLGHYQNDPAAPESFFYYENALPLRADSYDEFIFFDHQHARSWSDEEAARGMKAVDEWYAAHAPLPMSGVALPHWYEMGANTCAHARQLWGTQFSGKVMDTDLPLAPGVPWLPLGPFRKGTTGEAHPFSPGSAGKRPVYYADFVNLGGQVFFNSLTEIRDDAGYEWAPDNDVRATTARAVRQLRRALDSMALAQLFTHETDFIYKIRPENWRAIIDGVAKEIAAYQPIQMTLDDGMTYLRATKTSKLVTAHYQPETKQVTAAFAGQSDVTTHFWLFDQQDAEGSLVEVQAFEGQLDVQINI